VGYARTHLAPWAPQHMPELQRVLGALVFGASTKVAPYKALFSEGRWSLLLELFLRELYKLHALLPESALTVHLQVRGSGAAGGGCRGGAGALGHQGACVPKDTPGGGVLVCLGTQVRRDVGLGFQLQAKSQGTSLIMGVLLR
jgi:hypothetical protein